MNNHWRTLERLASYIRHDWDNYVRDCRDQRELPKHAMRRRVRYFSTLLIVVAPIALAVFAWMAVQSSLPYYSGFAASIVVAIALVSFFSVVITATGAARYNRASRYCAIKLTEALKTHKKERALDVLDLDLKEWLRASGRKKVTHWDGWTNGYTEGERAKLIEQGASEYDARLALSADPVLYVGNEESIRLIIGEADPAASLIKKLPAQQKTG